jgi:hypothetical protein
MGDVTFIEHVERCAGVFAEVTQLVADLRLEA